MNRGWKKKERKENMSLLSKGREIERNRTNNKKLRRNKGKSKDGQKN
jgi:hypothetical protein